MVEHIRNKVISGKTAFRLYDTFGFPIEMTVELAQEHGFEVDVEEYEKCFKEHRENLKQVQSKNSKVVLQIIKK